MENKIRVIAKAQNQTALGIINAYLLLNPHSTLQDLKEKFPNDVAPDKGVAELFVSETEANEINTRAGTSLYFAKAHQIFQIENGERIALSQIWTKDSLKNLINRIDNTGIQVKMVDSDEAKKEDIKGFKLEFLNGFDPSQNELKKGFLSSLIRIIKSVFGKR